MQSPLSGKFYLLKLASKHLLCPWVSIAFSVAPAGSMESQPGASRVLRLGVRRTARRGPCPKYGRSSVRGRISKPDSSSQTDSSSTNLPWMEWLYRLEFQLPPSSQRLFFPSLTRFLEVSHLRPSLLKIAPERTKHLKLVENNANILQPEEKLGVCSHQIWFVSQIVRAAAQGSGERCAGIAASTLTCSAGIAWVWCRIPCSYQFGAFKFTKAKGKGWGVCEIMDVGQGKQSG